MRVPSSTPAGMLTESVRSFCTCPLPRHALQGLRTNWPRPWQLGQVRSMVKKPCCARTLPAPEAIGPPAAAVLEGGMAEAVVSGALLAVLQDVIGFADFLETGPAAVIVGVAVGMKLLGKLAIGALDLLDRGVLLATQHFVEI